MRGCDISFFLSQLLIFSFLFLSLFTQVPKLFQGLEAWVYDKFLSKFELKEEDGGKRDPAPRGVVLAQERTSSGTMEVQTRPFQTMPVINDLTVASTLTQDMAWFLSCSIPETPVFVDEMTRNRCFHWTPLFLSSVHGFSLSHFENKCFDYPGSVSWLVWSSSLACKLTSLCST